MERVLLTHSQEKQSPSPCSYPWVGELMSAVSQLQKNISSPCSCPCKPLVSQKFWKWLQTFSCDKHMRVSWWLCQQHKHPHYNTKNLHKGCCLHQWKCCIVCQWNHLSNCMCFQRNTVHHSDKVLRHDPFNLTCGQKGLQNISHS